MERVRSTKSILLGAFLMASMSYMTLGADELKQSKLQSQILKEIDNYQKGAKNIYSLSDLFLAADKNNHSIASKNLDIDTSEKAIQIAIFNFSPHIGAQFRYSKQFLNVENAKDAIKSDAKNLSANLSWNLFNGFKDYYAYKQAQANNAGAILAAESVKNNVFLSIVNGYYSYFNNLARYFALQKKQQELEFSLNRIKSLYSQGLALKENIASLQAQDVLIKYETQSVRLEIEKIKQDLSLSTGLNIQALKYQKLKELDSKSKALVRSDINAMVQSLKALKFEEERLNYYPVVDFDYALVKPIVKKDAKSSYINTFGLTFSLKITDSISIALQKQLAQIKQLSLSHEIANLKNKQANELAIGQQGLKISKLKVQSAFQNYLFQNLAFKNIQQKFNSNLVNANDFLSSLSANFDALSNYTQSVNANELNKARFIVNSGLELQNYLYKD